MLESLTTRVGYTGNGTTAAYNYTFKIFDQSHLTVVVTDPSGAETTLTLTTHYTVSGVGELNGGTVTLVAGAFAWLDVNSFLKSTTPASAYTIDIIRSVPYTQTANIRNQGDYYPETHENALDKIVMQVQQLDENFDRVLQVPLSEAGTNLQLPSATARASSYLAFDSSGNPVASTATIGTALTTAYTLTLLDDANAAAARATLGFSGAGGSVATANIEDEAVTVAKIDDVLLLGLTTVTPLADDYVAISDTSDSGKNKKALISALPIVKAYTAGSGATATTAATRILEMSGASATITLHTAVGNQGQEIDIIHAGTSLTQVYTLATTGGQTVGGVASGSYAMYTATERLRLYSDNVNWKIRGHEANTDWAAYTPTWVGLGTPATNTAFWRRRGDSLSIRGHVVSGTSTAVRPTVTLPSSITIDTAKLSATKTQVLGTIYSNNTATATSIPVTSKGPFVLTVDNSANDVLYVSTIVDTDETFFTPGVASTNLPTGTAATFFALDIPITGWRT